MSAAPTNNALTLDEFIEWSARSGGSERGNYAGFLIALCDQLGVPRPDLHTGIPSRDHYVIDKPIPFTNHDGSTTTGYIDLYKRGCFVCETKQGIEKKRAKSAADALAEDESPDARPA